MKMVPWHVMKSLCMALLSLLLFLMLHSHVQGENDDSYHSNNNNDNNNNHIYDSNDTLNPLMREEEGGGGVAVVLSWWERWKGGPSAITQGDFLILCCILFGGFELMSYISYHMGEWIGAKRIPVRGKHLDDFSMVDFMFISINKITVVPFMYCFVKYVYDVPHVQWYVQDMTVMNTILAIPLLYIVYDFFYTILHGILHIKGIYGWIHKHHHHQKAPSRGNSDAINVHPIEYMLGEFNHLWAIHLVSKYILPFLSFIIRLMMTTFLNDDGNNNNDNNNNNNNNTVHDEDVYVDQTDDGIHVLAALMFVVVGGVLASMNHTRYDIVVVHSFLYDSKAHDVHHRIPQSNYGQYTMLWDHIFGTFRPYNETDRINPKTQLNLKTGKSLEWNGSGTNGTNNDNRSRSSIQKQE